MTETHVTQTDTHLPDMLESLAAAPDPRACARAMQEWLSATTGAEHLGVMLRREQRLHSCSATTPLAAAGDAAQRALRSGPAVAAMIDTDDGVAVPDTATDARWPDFVQRARALGVRSILAAPMRYSERMVGVVTAYSASPNAFAGATGSTLAAAVRKGGIVLGAKAFEAELRVALQTRETIGQAAGILMERHRITADEAFRMMVAVSQRVHRKVRDIAELINQTGEDPGVLLEEIAARRHHPHPRLAVRDASAVPPLRTSAG